VGVKTLHNTMFNVQQHAEGRTPWDKCGVDLFEFNQKYYLVTVDYFSNLVVIDVLTSTTASVVIHCLKRHFARYGIPKCVVSDSGHQFVSSLFEDFCSSWCILHVTSSLGHYNENGKGEAAIKSVKKAYSFTRHHQLSRTHSVSVCADGAYPAVIKIKKNL